VKSKLVAASVEEMASVPAEAALILGSRPVALPPVVLIVPAAAMLMLLAARPLYAPEPTKVSRPALTVLVPE
jgi:hypothetical protein